MPAGAAAAPGRAAPPAVHHLSIPAPAVWAGVRSIAGLPTSVPRRARHRAYPIPSRPRRGRRVRHHAASQPTAGEGAADGHNRSPPYTASAPPEMKMPEPDLREVKAALAGLPPHLGADLIVLQEFLQKMIDGDGQFIFPDGLAVS